MHPYPPYWSQQPSYNCDIPNIYKGADEEISEIAEMSKEIAPTYDEQINENGGIPAVKPVPVEDIEKKKKGRRKKENTSV